MQILATEKIPIMMWLDDIEDGALEQAKNLANLPVAFNHIAIMPDSHLGYGMPIGGVLATTDVIIPNSVGVDIGCGMCAVKTTLTDISKEGLKEIMGAIRKAVPVGFNHHKDPQDLELMPQLEERMVGDSVVSDEFHKARYSIGTLGGGNHFIEIQKGSDGHIWVMIHSGSRNLGKQVADFYNDLAVVKNKIWYSDVPAKHELAFLPVNSDEGQAYIREMNYCVEFALANRKLMMDRVIQIFRDLSGSGIDFEPMINIAHNYAALENHMGRNVWVHRKGATLAREGTVGIIPGSQGTKSYIVRGKGNKMSFESCSHGAGRKMGRKEAERTLDLAAEIKLLDDQGIIHAIRGKGDLDEAAGAYKPIDVVMNNQKDLVDILVELTPLCVIKG